MQTDFPLVPVNFDFGFGFMGGVLGIKSWLTIWKANAQMSYLLYYSSIDSWFWNMGLHFCFYVCKSW